MNTSTLLLLLGLWTMTECMPTDKQKEEDLPDYKEAPEKAFVPGHSPTGRIQLEIRAVNLLNRDFISKNDALCVVFDVLRQRIVGRTEHQQDSNRSVWPTMTTEYHFQSNQVCLYMVNSIPIPFQYAYFPAPRIHNLRQGHQGHRPP